MLRRFPKEDVPFVYRSKTGVEDRQAVSLCYTRVGVEETPKGLQCLVSVIIYESLEIISSDIYIENITDKTLTLGGILYYTYVRKLTKVK